MSQQTVHLDDLESLVGTPIGPTEWHDMDQRMVDGFADVTGDHQWIHTDPERAARGPFGSTIAHGFFTLSLAPVLSWELLTVEGVSMAVNYGLNKVRFPAPVPVGTAVRGTMTLVELTEVQGGLQSVSELTVERDGGTKPVCVAELVTRYYR
ncbi:Acyl dehydratase [Euzebya pacifica]|uniref:Acyl dehydratase n=1 Tax=Euzebya pacifica TaxID=1608957 RepID=A0A346XXX2_9ACTN|nr:MaoC family dehydratase [Euzebya pacifica]AXV07069.1 Acyl dehydratase [Euzebya pacifica]